MAYFPVLRRSVVSLLLSVSLAACSADSLVPPASVDSGTRVSSIQPRRVVSPVASRAQYSYPSSATPVSSASVDYLDTPNLAGVGHVAGRRAVTAAPMPADSTALQGSTPMGGGEGRQAPRQPQFQSQSQSQSLGPSASLTPSEGVNMDADLGAEPVVGLAQEEDQNIAEGESEQPVVDGIGTDNPVQANRSMQANTLRLPPSSAQAQLGQSQLGQSRIPQQGQQVAMLPRVGNPMLAPEPPMAPESAPMVPQVPAVMPASELQCRQELKRMGVLFQDKPPISNGPACQVPYPVSLKGLSGNINVSPAVTLNCQTTLAFAKWVKNELAPSARGRYWSGIGTIVPLGGYSCRKMNNSRQKYNPMSEHAHGNAIDVGKFVLKNGHEIDVRKKGLFSFREGGLLKAVRSDSCKYFDTVLGPGSNPEHWNHFHFDLRERHGGRRYCSL